MAKKKKEADPKALGYAFLVLLVIAILYSIASKVGEVIHVDPLIAAVLLFVVACCTIGFISSRKARNRMNYLVARYGPEAARLIVAKQVWQGATYDMMIDAFGPPADIDTSVMRDKQTAILKYYPQQGYNRYGMRITVENGYVIGWELK